MKPRSMRFDLEIAEAAPVCGWLIETLRHGYGRLRMSEMLCQCLGWHRIALQRAFDELYSLPREREVWCMFGR